MRGTEHWGVNSVLHDLIEATARFGGAKVNLTASEYIKTLRAGESLGARSDSLTELIRA